MVNFRGLLNRFTGKVPSKRAKGELTRQKLWASSHRLSKKVGAATGPERKDITQLERLFYMEPLLFSGINFYKQVIARGLTIQASSSQAMAVITEFLNQIDMEGVIEKIVQDLGIYGNAFVELIWDANRKRLLSLAIIDPKKMKFMKDLDGEILMDDMGEPIGYIQTIANVYQRERLEAIITKKGIPVDKIDYSDGGIPFAKEDIAHFKWHTLSDTLMGVGLVEPLYDTVILKLKCEEALANAIDKYGFPTYVANLGEKDVHEPDPEELKEFDKEVMSNIESMKDIVLPWYHKISVMDVPKIDRLRTYLDYFVDLICTGMGVPHSILLRGERIGAGVSELQADQVEKNIVSIQRNLARTIREQIFAPLIQVAGLDEIPDIKWKIISPLTLSAKSRRISELSRAGILTPDRVLEQEVRRLEDLPSLPEEEKVTEEEREELRKSTVKRHMDSKEE